MMKNSRSGRYPIEIVGLKFWALASVDLVELFLAVFEAEVSYIKIKRKTFS